MILMRWTMRLAGLVSTMVLARLLTPSDFGIVTVATIFVGLLDLFTSTNFDLALLRTKDTERSHYDTAWTLQLILGTSVGALIFVLAPLTVWYFEDSRVVWVTRLLAANVVLNGVGNIKLVDFRRNLDFRKEFLFNVSWKILSMVVTISMAVHLRSYWALVAGSLAGNLGGVVLGYVVRPYRPRFDLRHAREMISFSQWMLMFNVGTYLRNRIDTLLVARLSSPGAVGVYNVAAELSAMPTTEVVIPSGRALFPSFVKLAGDERSLKQSVRIALGVCVLGVIPICAGVALVAPQMVRVILGTQWLETVPLMPPLAFAGGLNAVSHVIGTFLAAIGQQRLTAALTWMNVAILIPTLLAAAPFGILGIAVGRMLVSVVVLIVALYFLVGSRVLTAGEIVDLAWRPIIAAGGMSFVVWILDSDSLPSPLLTLGLKIMTGVVSYGALAYLLWRASGSPDGAERKTLELLSLTKARFVARIGA